jgi:DNA-binding SARP family transcriptional activator
MATLTLTFLGSFQAALDDQPIRQFRSDKVRALLACLALEADRPYSRASLCGLLWPDQSDDAALHNLSQTLLRLRQALGDVRGTTSFLRISRQTIQWNGASDYRLDAADFARLAASAAPAELAQAAALYRGELLAGFSLPGCEAFEEWLLLVRERFAHLALRALDALTRAQLAEARYDQAAQYARRQLELDPWREEAHRQLMRALALGGDRAAALAQYAYFCQVLESGLGIEPDEQTHALYEQIRTNQLQAATQLTSAPAALRGASVPVHELHAGDEAPEPGRVFGREAELALLRRWLLDERCQVVALLGIGGVGKTTLAAVLAHAVAGQFELLFWRSLLNAPPLEELLRPLLQALTDQALANLPASLDDQLALLLDYLRKRRGLLGWTTWRA